MEEIKLNVLAKDLEEYRKEAKNAVVRHALSQNPLSSVVRTQDEIEDVNFNLDINIKTLSAANQKASGRCWIFAGLNILREIVAKQLKLSDFELSQNYISFYDKFEKINYMLENIIELCPRDYDDRTLSHVLKEGFQDGGQWDMFANIVKKYGVVPKVVMDETEQSSNTREGNYVICNTLRKFAAKASKLYKEGKKEEILNEKKEILTKLFKFLCMCYGKPVEKFDFEYIDSSKTIIWNGF